MNFSLSCLLLRNAFIQSDVSVFFTADSGLCFFTHVKNPADAIKLLRGFEIIVFDSCGRRGGPQIAVGSPFFFLRLPFL